MNEQTLTNKLCDCCCGPLQVLRLTFEHIAMQLDYNDPEDPSEVIGAARIFEAEDLG